MDNGYVKLYTRFLKWKWYKDTNTKVLFIHILLKANYEDKEWNGITIHRGELVSSVKKLREELGLTEQELRTSLSKLFLTHELTNKTTNKYTLFIVEKYNNYQISEDKITSKSTTTNIYTNLSSKIEDIRESVREREGVREVLDYLNEKTNRNYNYKSEKNRSIIVARLNEGYIIDDFKRVVDTKCNDWLKDEKFNEFLRPETLFGNKFDGYLNKAISISKKKTTLELLEEIE